MKCGVLPSYIIHQMFLIFVSVRSSTNRSWHVLSNNKECAEESTRSTVTKSKICWVYRFCSWCQHGTKGTMYITLTTNRFQGSLVIFFIGVNYLGQKEPEQNIHAQAWVLQVWASRAYLQHFLRDRLGNRANSEHLRSSVWVCSIAFFPLRFSRPVGSRLETHSRKMLNYRSLYAVSRLDEPE